MRETAGESGANESDQGSRMTKFALHRQPNSAPPSRPLTERGRIFYAEDIQTLYGMRPNGKPRRSVEWIQQHFAPAARCKDGREVFWWECDVIAAFDQMREGAA